MKTIIATLAILIMAGGVGAIESGVSKPSKPSPCYLVVGGWRCKKPEPSCAQQWEEWKTNFSEIYRAVGSLGPPPPECGWTTE